MTTLLDDLYGISIGLDIIAIILLIWKICRIINPNVNKTYSKMSICIIVFEIIACIVVVSQSINFELDSKETNFVYIWFIYLPQQITIT